ncbi:bacteriohemerythrin [Acidithrix sp. C25]|uniref:bacteriohemerythrin n=1 Tax=Acidithrix sp. C25 TaxID=1671482 RepID=UPI00191B9609|nr:bacteriohemerythrin [Acidithrix sp. C25]CAG4915055.1 unnamed protein product [Acidithrix sp. C25]
MSLDSRSRSNDDSNSDGINVRDGYISGQLLWSKQLLCGLDIVDDQHMRLVAIFNELAACLERSSYYAELKEILVRLVEYTRYHFGAEEELMVRFRLPDEDCRSHMQAHRNFVQFLERAQDFAQINPRDVILNLTSFLAQWLLHHIMEVDSRMTRQIRDCQEGNGEGDLSTDRENSVKDLLIDSVSALNDTLGWRTFEVMELNLKLEEEIQKSKRLVLLTRLLAEVNSAVVRANDEAELLGQVCNLVVDIVGMKSALIVAEANENGVEVVARAGSSGTGQYLRFLDLASSTFIERGSSLDYQLTVGDGQLNRTSNWEIEVDPKHSNGQKPFEQDAFSVPISRDGQQWGSLLILDSPSTFRQDQFSELLNEVAKSLSNGLERVDRVNREHRMHRQIEHLALHDPLTGLANRLRLEVFLEDALEKAEIVDSTVGVGILDLDDFKLVNDCWGHHAGDVVLREFARRIQMRLRDDDLVARLGGDEFVVVFRGIDRTRLKENLDAIMARLHEAVEAPFEVSPGCFVNLAMSLGVALYPFEARDGDMLMRKADLSLYRSKEAKGSRHSWWRMAGGTDDENDDDPTYGSEIVGLLERAHRYIEVAATEFVEEFYGGLLQESDANSIFSTLTVEEMHALKKIQASHLQFLLSPKTTRLDIEESAKRIGGVHALIGSDSSTLMRSVSMYRSLLNGHLGVAPFDSRDRYRLLLASEMRLHEDAQVQLRSMEETIGSYRLFLSREISNDYTEWNIIRDSELERLSGLPGIVGVALWKLDSEGEFRLEVLASAQNHDESKGDSGSLHANLFRFMGERELLSRSWHTETIVTTSNAQALVPLGEGTKKARGGAIRCVTFVPIFDENKRIVSLVEIYGAFPNQFASKALSPFVQGIQVRIGELHRKCNLNALRVVGHEIGFKYRQTLFSGGLQMYMQPIVNLATGEVEKFEALARLKTDDGTIIDPDGFLGLLGGVELDRLFRQGLDQTLDRLKEWDSLGMKFDISVNLPPSVLSDEECPNWVQGALEHRGVDAGRLYLELLETQEISEDSQNKSIARLVEMGVKLAIDDLGSGYGSLLRLSTLPFATIKVDREVLNQLYKSPLQTLSLMEMLINLGRDFGRDVVMEGLEDLGMVEAAKFLGAPYGQGYYFARPMAGDMVGNWFKDYSRRSPSKNAIQTDLGALAYFVSKAHKASQFDKDDFSECLLVPYLESRLYGDGALVDLHKRVHGEGLNGDAHRVLLESLVVRVLAVTQGDLIKS